MVEIPDSEYQQLQSRLKELEAQAAEHKQIEEALRESEEKYHSVAERANDGIIIIHDGIIKYVNRRLAEMYGDAVENIMGNPFKKYIAPEELPKVAERYQKRIRGESLESMYEMMIQRKDGSRIPAEVNAGTITYQGKPADLIFVRDITERKRVEEELRADKEKYRTLVENLPQKIFHKDKNSVYISCNQNYARDLKIKSDEIAGKTDYDFYPKELAEKYRTDDKRIMKAGKIEDIEEKYIQDGEERFVHTVKTPIKDEKGNVIGILGIFWDITERKRAEEELANKVKELEKITKIMEGREDRIIELKNEVKELKRRPGEKG
jgi:PAS domain S-box-containing protein